MNSETIEQLRKDIQKEMQAAINNSKLGDVFQNYDGLNENGIVKFQCLVDLTNIEFNNTSREQHTVKDDLQKNTNQKLLIVSCCRYPGICDCCGC